MNRTARLDFNPMAAPAYIPMTSRVAGVPVEVRHEQPVEDAPRKRGRPKAVKPVRTEPVHNLREPG